jgi:hypothetical protein
VGRLLRLVLLCATSFVPVTGVRADDRDDRNAVAVDTPNATKHGELVFHGNYCGAGNRAGVEPIDALDLTCIQHGACTPSGRIQNCACERLQSSSLHRIARDCGGFIREARSDQSAFANVGSAIKCPFTLASTRISYPSPCVAVFRPPADLEAGAQRVARPSRYVAGRLICAVNVNAPWLSAASRGRARR